MKYKILLSRKSSNFLNKLDKKQKTIIKSKLRKLSTNPELGKPLLGRLRGLWNLRVGIYRAIYQIRREEICVFILKIGHRKNIYERI